MAPTQEARYGMASGDMITPRQGSKEGIMNMSSPHVSPVVTLDGVTKVFAINAPWIGTFA
jgi:hypothetical protein